MSDENKQVEAVLGEIALEMRRLRQSLLVSFAIFSLIGGLLLLCHPSYEVPLYAFFAATAIFLVWAAGSYFSKIVGQVGEEVRRQNSPPGKYPPR